MYTALVTELTLLLAPNGNSNEWRAELVFGIAGDVGLCSSANRSRFGDHLTIRLPTRRALRGDRLNWIGAVRRCAKRNQRTCFQPLPERR
jgi:hypothetical protein